MASGDACAAAVSLHGTAVGVGPAPAKAALIDRALYAIVWARRGANQAQRGGWAVPSLAQVDAGAARHGAQHRAVLSFVDPAVAIGIQRAAGTSMRPSGGALQAGSCSWAPASTSVGALGAVPSTQQRAVALLPHPHVAPGI